MSRSFRDALICALESTGTPLRQVAGATGVSYEQLKKLKQGRSRSTNVDDAKAVANFFGQSLDQFLEDEDTIVRLEIVSLYNQLSPEERRFLLASARGLRAQDPEKR